MTVFNAIKKGLYLTMNNKRMLSIVYLINILLGIVIIYPVYNKIKNITDASLWADKILERFNFTFFSEFLLKYPSIFDNIKLSVFVIGLFYILITIFFAGGILKIFKNEGKFDAFSFFGGCGKYFLRFFRLFLYSIIFYIAFIIIFAIINSVFVVSNFTSFIIMAIILIAGLCFVDMLFDYAKIDSVYSDNRKMYKSVWKTLKFVFKNFFKVIFLYSIIFVIGVVLFLLFNYISKVTAATSSSGIIILFIIQQVYIISKFFTQLLFYSSQYVYYSGKTPVEAPPEKIEPIIGQEDEVKTEPGTYIA